MTIEKTSLDRCRYCKLPFSDEILKKIKDNKEDVICQHCGDIVKRIQDNYNLIKPEADESKSNYNILPTTLQTDIIDNQEALLYPNGRIFYDKDFPPIFKSNFIIVFSRLVYFHIRRLESIGQLKSAKMEISENIINELHMCISSVQRMRIKNEFLNDLHLITVKVFDKNLKKLQEKIQLNKEYQQDFIIYCRWLIRRVYTLVAEKFESSTLSKFERTIIKDLKEFELIGINEEFKPVNTNDKSNSILYYSILERPAKIVNHYYDALGKCRRNSGSPIRRHNYIIISNQQISCVDCGYTILNPDVKESSLYLRKHQLENLDKNKQAGDMTIYRISVKRIFKNGKLEWLPFPGLNYVGQTIYTGEKRFKSHITSAFGNDKNTEFGNFIIDITNNGLAQPNKKKAKSLIKKILKVEILQIVRFQGEWEAIRKIIDHDELQKKIKKADRVTEELANEVEKYWIGWYKTQYEEFGKNIEEGGSLRGSTAADLMDVDILFRQGYLPVQIGRKVGLQGNDDSIRKTITGYIKFRLYPNIFYPNGVDNPAISFRDGRRIIFKGILEDLVIKRKMNYKELLHLLPGFENPKAKGRLKWQELKRITLQTHGGIDKLVKKHYNEEPKNYYEKSLELIRRYGRKYSDFDLAKELGFLEDFKYTIDSLKKNAGRAIKNHVGKSIIDLRDDAFPPKDITYYIPKAIELIRKNYKHGIQNGGYGAGKLAVDLELPEHLCYSEKYIRDRGPKILKIVIKMSYSDLVRLTFDD